MKVHIFGKIAFYKRNTDKDTITLHEIAAKGEWTYSMANMRDAHQDDVPWPVHVLNVDQQQQQQLQQQQVDNQNWYR